MNQRRYNPSVNTEMERRFVDSGSHDDSTVSDGASGKLLSPDDWQALASHFNLTPRETMVAALIIEGEEPKNLAARLGIADQTVRHHLRNLRQKLRAEDLRGIVLQLLRTSQTLKSQNGEQQEHEH